MRDYTWPSIYFAYLFFALSPRGSRSFSSCARWKDGYWGKESEAIKFQVFENERVNHGTDETQD